MKNITTIERTAMEKTAIEKTAMQKITTTALLFFVALFSYWFMLANPAPTK